MQKYDEECHTLEYFKDMIRCCDSDDGIILEEMKIEYGSDYFWCSVSGEPGIVGESDCGRLCKDYEPRNKKNGRCRFSKNCYEGTGKFFELKGNNLIIKSGVAG